MEDPPPLEEWDVGVLAAFAAVVRKLMSKTRTSRYIAAAELRPILGALATDLGSRCTRFASAEAEAARSFRPPPPELAEDDLRLFDNESIASRDSLSIRELGGAEPSFAPRHQSPPPPMPALFRQSQETFTPGSRRRVDNDTRWLIHFAIIAAAAGLIAIAFIAIFLRS